MARIRFSPALALLLVPLAVFAQSEFTAPPSGPAIVAPAQGETIYGTPYKPGQPYKPPVAKPPTVPKPASSTPVPSGYGMPTIVIPATPAPAPSATPKPSTPAIPLPGQGPVIVKPAPSPTIPLPGQGPVIVKPASSPAIPLPGQGPVIVKPAPSVPLGTQTPVIVQPAPTATPPSTPLSSTPKPEPVTSKPPATATSAPPPPIAKPTEAPVGDPRAEEENRRRRAAEAAEAAARARDAAKASGERAKQGLAYPDVQPMTPGTAVNVAPQTEPPSSGEIRGLGAKIQQLQKEAAVAPKPTPPEGKPPANDCDPSTPEQCAAIQRELERQKREADRRLREDLRRERERAEREQRRLDREAERRERNARREANRQEREAQRERERDLGKDADDISRERDRLEGRREARDSEGRDLREREQNLRRGGDPNCQSAECRQVRQQQADLQKERVQDLKAETDLQRRGEKFDREYRRHRAEGADLEKRLDRGEGLSPEEHKDRMEAKERNRVAGDMDRRMNTLEQKGRDASAKKGPPLTSAEREELRKLQGSDSGKTMGNAMREQADEAARRVDFERLSGVSTGELRETARDLGRGAQQLGDLEKRVGMGGPQPPAGDGAPSARETELQRQREKVNAEMNRIGNGIERQSTALNNLNTARRYTESQLKDAKEKGASADEIRRLERKLVLENDNYARGEREMDRLHRENARAGDDSRRLAERQGNAALANAGEFAAGVVNDYNSSYGNLIDEKGNVRQDVLRREVAQTERSFQQLDKAAPGSPEQKQALDQLSRQGLDFQVDGGGKVTSWSARTPYAGAVGDAAHNEARLAELEAKHPSQLTERQRPELQYLQNERAASRDMVRRASQPAAPAAPAAPDNSLTGRFKREAKSGQSFQQWYAEEQQRVAGPASSPGERRDAAEAKERAGAANLDREAAERQRQRAGAQRAADDRAAERYLRYGRVEDEPAKPATASAPAPAPGQAADASARRDADAAARNVAASEGGIEAWRGSRDRQNQDRLTELEKKNNVSGAEQQEIGRLRARLDESRKRQEAERAPKPVPARAAAAPQRGSAPRVVEYRDHVAEELERSRRAVEQAKDGTPVERLRAATYRAEAEINEAERDGEDADAMRGRLAGTRKELGDALQREVAEGDAASTAQRAASLETRQQEDERKRGDQLAAAARRPEGASAVVPRQVASAPRPTTTPEQRTANAAQRDADEAAAAQKRREELAERERRAEQEAKERALKFGTLPADAFKPIDPGPAAAATEERRAAQAQRDAATAAGAEKRRLDMAAAEERAKREAGERILKYGGSAPAGAAAPVKPGPMKPEPPLQVAAIKRDPLPLVPPTPPAGYTAEPQPTARPNDAATANGRPLGEGDPQARERYLAGLQQQIEKRLDGSEFARTAIPAIVTAFADQLGPAATDALLAATFARAGSGTIDAARFLEALFTEVDARAAAGGDAEAARASRMAHATALDSLVNDRPPGASAGLTESQRQSLRAALHTLAQALVAESSALAGSANDPVAQALRHADVLNLSGMLDPQDQTTRIAAEASAKALTQILAGLKSNPGNVAVAGDLAIALEVAEGGLRTLPANVDPAVVEGLVGALGDGYRALAETVRRSTGGDPAMRAQLIAEAESREARSRLATGRAADALQALAPRSGEDAATAAARAAQRGALLERVIGLYAGLSAGEQAKLGDPAKLNAERIASLRSALAAEQNSARIAAHAVPLIRALEGAGQAADALKVVSDAATRAPSDPMLQGEKLRLELLAQGNAAKLLEGIPQSARPAALAIALDGLASAGRVDLIDGLAAAATASLRSSPTLANALAVQADLAAIDALSLPGGDPKALSDRIAATRNRLGLESGLPLDTIRTFSAALDQADARARTVRGWRQSLDTGKPPAGGFLGVSREALQAGRLDVAAEATIRALEGFSRGGPEQRMRGLAEAQALANMVEQRLAAPDLSASQRAAGSAFLKAVGEPLRRGLAEFAESQRTLLRALLDARNNTPERQASFDAEYDEVLQRVRETARLRLELDLPGMNAEQRNARVNGRIGELNKQIADKDAAVRKEFAGLREQVRTGEARGRLDQRLAELDALRAERDGLQDHQLDANRTTAVAQRIGEARPVDSRTAELWNIERRLNGYNQGDGPLAWDDMKLSFGRSVQGRTRGLRGDRITQRLRDANPDNWLETLMVGNEGEYLERRRGQVVMEDPRRTSEQRRATLAQSYRFEADQYKRQGDSYLFNEITGTGEVDLNRARERYGQMESQRVGWLRADMEKAAANRDAQGFFRSMVGLREAQLAGQIDAYAAFVNDDWTTRGPVKGVRIGLYGRSTGATLDAASAADAALHPALIRASYHPASDLSAEDRALLTEAGFMRNGQYVIPSRSADDLTTVSTAGTDFARETVIDRYVNFRQAAELAATVVIPGGFSSRIAGNLVARAGMRELLAATGARQAAGVIATWAGGKALEAGLFTATSRAARTLLDPTLILDESAWGWGAFGKEYAHNLAVISALGLGGGAMGATRQYAARALGERIAGAGAYTAFHAASGAAMVVGEAALLTGLDRLASGNAITQEHFVGNLLTVGMLKASHGQGGDLRGIGGEIGQLTASQRRYEAWNREQAYQRLADSPAGEMLRKNFGGSWDAARKAHKAKEITDAQMDMLLELRGTVVDRLIAEIKGELGGEVSALGSVNRTSDYDLSFSGPKAELAVILFNARFGGAWRTATGFGGGEAAARFDTNLYTRPVFDDIGRGGAVDAWVQEGFAQLQARRNMDGARWKAHVAETLAATKAPEMRARMQELLERVDQRFAEFEKTVQERLPGAADELGLPRESADADRATRNRLYEDALREILGLKDTLAKTTNAAERESIMSRMRQFQSKALYFAAEAYLTQAAINHVVDSVQSSGRSINARTLLAPGIPGTGKVKIDENFARQSLIEQKGYIGHYLDHGGAPLDLSLKVGKYFIRVLDAMRLAGRSLASREGLVRSTGLIDARRGDATAVKNALAARQMLADLRANATEAVRRELDNLQQRLQTARDNYEKVDESKLSKDERKALKAELTKTEDAVTTDVLNNLAKLGGGSIDAAADRAASNYIAEAEKALSAFTTDLAGAPRLDTQVAQRFRKRRRPKTRHWRLRCRRAPASIPGVTLAGDTGGESGIRTHGT